jgi:hypothetical protein
MVAQRVIQRYTSISEVLKIRSGSHVPGEKGDKPHDHGKQA